MKAAERENLGGVLGDKGFEYLYVHILATAPEEQGHGYGNALMNFLLSDVSAHEAVKTRVTDSVFATGRRERIAHVPILKHACQCPLL